MTDEKMSILADKYLKNNLEPEDVEKVLTWFTTEAGTEYLKNQLAKDVQLLENETLFISPAKLKSAEMLSNILSEIEKEDNPSVPKETAKVIEPSFIMAPAKTRRYLSWYKIVAVAACLAAVFFTYRYYNYQPIIRSTNYGETARIVLPDSSYVTLNGNSSIEYSADWNSSEPRSVKLKGEGFFSIRHKANNQKFIVETADSIQIEVLGTEFNVSDRKRQTQVVLVSGKIQLAVAHKNQQTESLILKPGESVAITPNNRKLQTQSVDPVVATSWTGDKLIFDSTTVREICERLKETYGYKINITDQKILNQRITGSVPNENIDKVLQGLEAILDVKLTKTN